MVAILVESICPRHGFERFKIRIVRKYNMKPDVICPKFRTKPREGLSCLLVGRNVNIKDVETFLNEYFNQKEPNLKIIKMTTLIKL